VEVREVMEPVVRGGEWDLKGEDKESSPPTPRLTDLSEEMTSAEGEEAKREAGEEEVLRWDLMFGRERPPPVGWGLKDALLAEETRAEGVGGSQKLK
jgi:hypothetical protein